MEFEKNLNNHGKIMEFVKYFDETTSCQKTSCLTHVSDGQFSGYWWFQVLIISKCMHGLSTSMLLLLHSAFMLGMVKMLLKEEVGGSALNSHGNYIADHGKIMELCFRISVGTLLTAIRSQKLFLLVDNVVAVSL